MTPLSLSMLRAAGYCIISLVIGVYYLTTGQQLVLGIVCIVMATIVLTLIGVLLLWGAHLPAPPPTLPDNAPRRDERTQDYHPLDR